jgi:bacterioferritin-associated ferredoxin
MYICLCTPLTETETLRLIEEQGIHDLKSLGRVTGACRECGKCAIKAHSLIKDHAAKQKEIRHAA